MRRAVIWERRKGVARCFVSLERRFGIRERKPGKSGGREVFYARTRVSEIRLANFWRESLYTPTDCPMLLLTYIDR